MMVKSVKDIRISLQLPAGCNNTSCCCETKSKKKSTESVDESDSPPVVISLSFAACYPPMSINQIDGFITIGSFGIVIALN